MSPCDYPYGHVKNDRCYQCYLKQCKAYGFYPLDEATWKSWQTENPDALPVSLTAKE